MSRRAMLGATAAIGAMSLPAVAEARVPVSTSERPDAELFRLLAGLPALREAEDLATARQDALWMKFSDQEPERPDALRVRTSDGFNVSQCEERGRDGRWRWFYEAPAEHELAGLPQAALEYDERRDGRWITVPDEARIARRAEIVAALDAGEDERDIVKARLGIPQADDEAAAANNALHRAWDAMLSTTPLTLAGLVAKARWATARCAGGVGQAVGEAHRSGRGRPG